MSDPDKKPLRSDDSLRASFYLWKDRVTACTGPICQEFAYDPITVKHGSKLNEIPSSWEDENDVVTLCQAVLAFQGMVEMMLKYSMLTEDFPPPIDGLEAVYETVKLMEL